MSRRAEWFLPAERGSGALSGPAVGSPAVAAAVGGGGKDKATSKGHGTGALVAAGAAGVIGGALLGGLAGMSLDRIIHGQPLIPCWPPSA